MTLLAWACSPSPPCVLLAPLPGLGSCWAPPQACPQVHSSPVSHKGYSHQPTTPLTQLRPPHFSQGCTSVTHPTLPRSLSLPRCSNQYLDKGTDQHKRNQLAPGLVSKPLTFSAWHPRRSRSFLAQVLLTRCRCPGCPLTLPTITRTAGLPCLTSPHQSLSLAPSVHSLMIFTRRLSP